MATLRDVQPHELDSILALNNAAGETILPLDREGLQRLYDQACYFRLAEVDGRIAGFLIALREDADYDSPNFLWFQQKLDSFVYIDRIVIDRPHRGLGLGRVFYADVTSHAEVRVPHLTCEVFLEPRDDVSLLFHGTFGFQEVGQQVMATTGRRVALLAKALCSYPFVRETWHDGQGGLPELPWLAERQRSSAQPAQATGEA